MIRCAVFLLGRSNDVTIFWLYGVNCNFRLFAGFVSYVAPVEAASCTETNRFSLLFQGLDHTKQGSPPTCIYLKPTMDGYCNLESVQTKGGDKTILENMILEFPANSVTAIMGPSGSG